MCEETQFFYQIYRSKSFLKKYDGLGINCFLTPTSVKYTRGGSSYRLKDKNQTNGYNICNTTVNLQFKISFLF